MNLNLLNELGRIAGFSFAPTRLRQAPRLPRACAPWAAFFRRFAAENGTVLERSRSLGRAEDHDVGSAGKRYTPGGVIFWNHEVSGRTGAKSLERNELQAKSRKTKT